MKEEAAAFGFYQSSAPRSPPNFKYSRSKGYLTEPFARAIPLNARRPDLQEGEERKDGRTVDGGWTMNPRFDMTQPS